MKAIRVWYAVDRDDTFIQKHLTEMLTVKCGTAMEKHIPLQVNCLMV